MIERLRSWWPLGGAHRYRSALRHNQGARTILLLLGAIVLAMTLLTLSSWAATMRRTGSADIQIVTSELQPGSAYEQSPTGRWIRYTYVVRGTTYHGYDFRRWKDVDAHDPKVCYDPADPSDHLLVDGSASCGVDIGP